MGPIPHEEMSMSASSRIAIVTGGSRGIGRDAVLRLAERGIASIITYHSRADDAEKGVAAVKEAGAAAVALQLDVSDTASFDGFVARVCDALAKLGAQRFDFLVNNAGT